MNRWAIVGGPSGTAAGTPACRGLNGWPAGVGWRPLDLFQSHYLMNVCGVGEATVSFYLGAMLR